MNRYIPKKTLTAFVLAILTRSHNFLATNADDFSTASSSGAAHSKTGNEKRPKSQLPSNKIQLKDTFIEIEGHTIGDEHRSETSSKQFFNNIDKDRDGKLGQSELSQFLMTHIGGLTLDTDIEAQTEAEAILDKLDHNKDSSLDTKDVFRYWKSLDSLLTVDEVAEWVVHSVQLPHEIGEIFRNNHVTGYDFPELVDNGGKALKEELNIEKAIFRKKIVRLVNARMLGIGSRPEKPSGVQIHLEGCSTAILTWTKSKAGGFPVHKFRVQRRRLSSDHDDLPFGNHSSKTMAQKKCIRNNYDEPNYQEDSNGNIISTDISKGGQNDIEQSDDGDGLTCSSNYEKNILEWQDVFDKSMPEFHDFSLRRGHGGYQYRIQAWNAVGKSEWVLVQFKDWTRRKCHRQKSKRQIQMSYTSASSIFGWLSFIFRIIYSFGQVLLYLFGLIVPVLKARQVLLPSSPNNIDLKLASILRKFDEFMLRKFGRRVIPKYICDTIMNENISVDDTYDRMVKIDQCFGYEGSKSNIKKKLPTVTEGDEDKRPKETRIKYKVKKSKKGTVAGPSLRKKNPKSLSTIKSKQESTEENTARVPDSGLADVTMQNQDSLVENSENTPTCVPCDSDGTDDKSIQDENNLTTRSLRPANHFVTSGDDVCNICNKRYKFGKRKRHVCCVCSSGFCHKHGKTTHSNIVSCKVPGTCICNNCLEIQKLENQAD